MNCHCGLPLHYTDENTRLLVERLVLLHGPDIPVTVGGRTWLVQRHYIALHGIKSRDLSKLGFPEVVHAEH